MKGDFYVVLRSTDNTPPRGTFVSGVSADAESPDTGLAVRPAKTKHERRSQLDGH